MKRWVHRLATAEERERYPNAYTFNRASGRFHNREGFEIPGSYELPRARKRGVRG